MKTLIVIILDSSGSMNFHKNDIIGGFNNFIESQKKIDGDEARLCLITFNNKVKMVFKPRPIDQVPLLNESSYTPRGPTALYDAITNGICAAKKYEDNDDRFIIVIMTDGKENASMVSENYIKRLMKKQQSKDNWSFVYIGEEPDRWCDLMQMDINNSQQFNHDTPDMSFASVTDCITTSRTSSKKKFNNIFNN